MNKTIALIVGLGLLAALLLFSMTYTVNFHEVAIKTRFGQTSANSVITEPGLKFRLPLFADRVTTYDTRLQLRESPLDTILTSDGQELMVRAFMLWRVNTTDKNGPLEFFESYSTIEEANQSLGDQFVTALRVGLSRYAFDDLIGPKSRLQEAEQAIKTEMLPVTAKGIEPVSVGISQLVLPAKTTAAVLERMNATRARISEIERNKGQTEATGIRSRASTLSDKIRAFAEQRAVEISAAGRKDAAKYLQMMNQEKDLAIFLVSLDALENILGAYTTVIMPTAFAPFHLLQMSTPTNAQGIPQPSAQAAFPGVNTLPAPLVGQQLPAAPAPADDQVKSDAVASPSPGSSSP